MPGGRLVSCSMIAVVVALLAATVDAQFPKLRVPKAPSVPGIKAPSAPAATETSQKSFECSQITEDLVERLLKGDEAARKAYEAAQKAYDAEMAKAKAKRAEADAIEAKRAQGTMGALMQNAECKDAFKEKDPRAREIARLEDQVAAADEAGDEKKSDALHKKLGALTEPLELDADRACGGKGSAALHDCMEQKKVALAKQGITGPMLTVQAQGECMSDPSTSGIAGMTGESDEEKTLRAEADATERQAKEAKQQADRDASKTESDESGVNDRDRAIFVECCVGVENKDPVWLAKTPAEARAVLQKHEGQLERICK